MKTSWGRSFKDRKGTIFVFIIIVSWVTITTPPTPPHPKGRRLKWDKDQVFLFFGRAAADEAKTFQRSYLERRGAYWKAQFPILSQVRTQTRSHAECEMRPRHKTLSQTGSGTQKIQTKERGGHYVRFRGDSSSHSWPPLWERKTASSHIHSPCAIRDAKRCLSRAVMSLKQTGAWLVAVLALRGYDQVLHWSLL